MVTLAYTRTLYLAVLGVSAVLFLSGCSFSDSSGSISKSVSSPSRSSSKDSEKDTKKTEDNRYENQVQDYTATYMRTNPRLANLNAFMKGISDVASQNGIVDWEANPKTYRAIGIGLRKARISGVQYEDYKEQLSNGDSVKMGAIQEGYNE